MFRNLSRRTHYFSDASKAALHTLHARLQADGDIVAAYALLPLSSYHVTLRGVDTVHEARGAREYNNGVVRRMAAMLELEQSFCDVNTPFHLEPRYRQRLAASPVAAAGARVPNYAHVHLEATGAAETQLRQWESASLDFLQLQPGRQEWHMTLGYWRPRAANVAEQAFAQRQHIASQKLAALLTAFFEANVVEVTRPRVCWFHNMTQFAPLEASSAFASPDPE